MSKTNNKKQNIKAEHKTESKSEERTYQIYIFKKVGVLEEMRLTKEGCKRLLKGMFHFGYQTLNPGSLVFGNKAFPSKLKNHWVYVDEIGVQKGLPKNYSVCIKTRDMSKAPSRMSGEEYLRLPLINIPILGYAISIENFDEEDDEDIEEVEESESESESD
jgi:hypothetical protein